MEREFPPIEFVPVAWRETAAIAVECRIAALELWLETSADLLELLEHAGDVELARELRPAIAAVRSSRNDHAATLAAITPDGRPAAHSARKGRSHSPESVLEAAGRAAGTDDGLGRRG